jgi:hypothetical protein
MGMRSLSSSELADTLKVSRGRVSQYVKEGKLEGCYQGSGRDRRFDMARVAAALGRVLDQGQMMGNGAETRRQLHQIAPLPGLGPDQDGDDEPAPRPAARTAGPQKADTELPQRDPDRYELARTQKAEEEARRLRRQNAESEGTVVLASEVALQTTRLVNREVQAMDAVLQAGARAVADRLGVDYREARAILTQVWREHRAKRSVDLGVEAAVAAMTPAEAAEDI